MRLRTLAAGLKRQLFRCWVGIALALAMLTPCGLVEAQYTTATLGGNVADATGAAVPEARVTARNVDIGLTQTISTDAAGAFLFSRLAVGNYELKVEKQGFATYVQSGITLSVNQVANQAVTLQVGQVNEQLTVEGSAELVVTRTATAGQLVDERRLVDLPLNGRSAQQLVFVAAGTVDLTNRYCGVNCQGGVYPGEQTAGVNGTGSGQVNYQLDGTDHNDSYVNMNLPFPNPDAIQEFNLQSSNFTAEYGNAAGGIVNIVTKSGTNQLHGTAFEFLRNGSLNARNFFAPTHDTLKRNQYGGSIGGPIMKNKLFFFGTYQGTTAISAASGRIAFVPTAAERAGDFFGLTKAIIDPVSKTPFPNNQIPASRLNPVSNYFLKSIPLPNAGGRQVQFPGVPSKTSDNQFMTKVDYNLTKHQISGRYFFTNYSQPAVIPTDNVLQATSSGNQVRVQTISIIDTYMVSPTLLVNTTFGLNRQRGGSLSSAPFSFPDAGVHIAAPTPPELSMSVSGVFSIGTNHAGDFDRGDFNIREVVTKIKGAHELHFGGEAIRLSNHTTNTYQMAGSFSFSGQLSGDAAADFMVGRAATFRQGGGEFKDLRGTKWSLFAQDNYRVSPSLTLNLGLRWDPYLPYYDREGRVVCFQPGVQSTRYPNAPLGLTYGGTNPDPGCPVAGSDAGLGNIEPRIGFAYRLTQDGRTSIRGGAGYFYTPSNTTDYNAFANIAPFAPTFLVSDVAFEDPFRSAGITNPFPAQYGPKVPGKEATFTTPTAVRWTFPRNFRIPQFITWNLIVERQVGGSWVFRLGYYGNKGTYLNNSSVREINPAIYVPGASTIANTQARRFYQNFANIGLIESGGNSHYNSMQFNVEKRFSHGLSVLVNYTWQKTLDDNSWSNPFNRRSRYGISNDDVPHVFKFSNIWQIPKMGLPRGVSQVLNGWSVNSMVLWQSGFPFSVSSGLDNSFSGVGSDQADFLGGTAILGSGRSHAAMIQSWFDTSKFTVNAVGTFGNSGRNILRTPRLFNTDFSLLKDIRATERLKVQLRAEFFNLFNNVNFNGPNATVTSAQFGRITGAGSPRILQFALKAVF